MRALIGGFFLSKAVTCSAPPSIAHGRTTAPGGGNVPEGTVVNYICNTGYVLVGLSQKRCESTGQWSGGEARCGKSNCIVRTLGNAFANSSAFGLMYR